MYRQDPGACIICGAPHCACGGGPITMVQLPQRDAMQAEAQSTEPPVELVAPAAAEPDPPAPFTTSSYRGMKRRGPSSRP